MNELIVLQNVRRLVSKAYNKRTPNALLVKRVFGFGSTTSFKKCEELGIDPFSHKI